MGEQSAYKEYVAWADFFIRLATLKEPESFKHPLCIFISEEFASLHKDTVESIMSMHPHVAIGDDYDLEKVAECNYLILETPLKTVSYLDLEKDRAYFVNSYLNCTYREHAELYLREHGSDNLEKILNHKPITNVYELQGAFFGDTLPQEKINELLESDAKYTDLILMFFKILIEYPEAAVSFRNTKVRADRFYIEANIPKVKHDRLKKFDIDNFKRILE